MTPLTELEVERNRALTRMRELIDNADGDGRSLTGEERQEFECLEARVAAIDTGPPEDSWDDDAGGTAPRGLTVGAAERERSTAGLRPGQRVEDWFAQRGGRTRSAFTHEHASDFSLGRLVRGMVTGRWDEAEVEKRALSEGTDSAGGFLTPEPLGPRVIDLVRKQARVLEAGATTFPMGSDQHHVARLATGVTPAWRNENASVAESDPGFERVTFVARTLAVLVRLSYELFEDMTSESAALIQNDLIQQVSNELDRVALRGSGTAPEPRGVRNQSGVEVQSMGANGASLTSYDPLLDAIAGVRADNIEPNAMLYASRTAQSLSKLKDTTNQPLRAPEDVAALRRLVTNQVPVNITQGTSTDTSEVYTGDFTQLWIGVRPEFGVRVQTSRDAFLSNMQIGILAFLRGDVQLAHPQGFVVTTGVRP
jgi:HK97 family phage major capsid protein